MANIQSRNDKIKESMVAPQKIDLTVEMRFPLSNNLGSDKK